LLLFLKIIIRKSVDFDNLYFIVGWQLHRMSLSYNARLLFYG